MTEQRPAYYAVKLNVPWDKADAIKSLVPQGEPVSGTLVSVLLKVAADGGVDISATPSTTESKRVLRLERRVKRLEDRLDAALDQVRRNRSMQ